jgi:hypothetical protein
LSRFSKDGKDGFSGEHRQAEQTFLYKEDAGNGSFRLENTGRNVFQTPQWLTFLPEEPFFP